MKLRNQTILLSALLSISVRPAAAQVEQVAIRTTGISCGVCAAVSEINFKRMPGIDAVKISLSKETIVLSYKPGATFDPQEIRQVLRPLEVGIVQLQVCARGQVREQGGKRYFTAGKNQFALAPAVNTATNVPNSPVLIEGIVDDRIVPMELKILNFKPPKP